MKAIPFLILLFCLSLLGCEKEKNPPANDNSASEHLIFGHFYGFCFGENCIATFALTQDSLAEDSLDQYFNSEMTFAWVPRSEEDFAAAAHLLPDFPSALWDTEEGTIGCPDCADQGGVLLSYTRDGVTKTWRIDNDLQDVPTYLHAYLGAVRSVIQLLQ